MNKKIISSSSGQTEEIGFELAQKIKDYSFIALFGDLGYGKTTFIKGLARGLGLQKNVISPSYIIMRTYDLPDNSPSHKKIFYHVDLYRLDRELDIKALGLLDLMNDPLNIFAVEWPEKMKNLLPPKRVDIFFRYLNEKERELIFDFLL